MAAEEQVENLREAIDNLGKVMYSMDRKHEDYEILRNMVITLRGLLAGYETFYKVLESSVK